MLLRLTFQRLLCVSRGAPATPVTLTPLPSPVPLTLAWPRFPSLIPGHAFWAMWMPRASLEEELVMRCHWPAPSPLQRKGDLLLTHKQCLRFCWWCSCSWWCRALATTWIR